MYRLKPSIPTHKPKPSIPINGLFIGGPSTRSGFSGQQHLTSFIYLKKLLIPFYMSFVMSRGSYNGIGIGVKGVTALVIWLESLENLNILGFFYKFGD